MTPYNEQEYNRLCAEFLGSELKNDGQFDYWTYDHLGFDPMKIRGSSWVSGNFEFHSDWNWIMEVVEKIRVTYFQGLPFQFKINDETGYVYIVHHLMDNAYFIQVLIKDKLKEAVVQAIWEFLQWYNEQEFNKEL